MKVIQITLLLLGTFLIIIGCNKEQNKRTQEKHQQYITVLGIAQDAGFPHINCKKACCEAFYSGNEPKKMVSCLGLVDLESKQKWLFDATPDITQQLENLRMDHLENGKIIDGIFLTHAHIGHYTGLMYFGLEAMGARGVPVYAMPKMKHYLEQNGPWSQLVNYNNIELVQLQNDSTMVLNSHLNVTPILVPHRDEYSETVGYVIKGRTKSALFIPDIDKWHKWERHIIDEVKKADYAFLDASFFKDGEISRPMNKIPHPFTTETTTLFENESTETKAKIHFIHFNHTNPALLDFHPLKDSIMDLGFNFAKEGAVFPL